MFIHLFTGNLSTLSVAQTIQDRIVGWLENNKLERTWKEAVMTYFEMVNRHLPGGNEENK
jgi:hypothetical protein